MKAKFCKAFIPQRNTDVTNICAYSCRYFEYGKMSIIIFENIIVMEPHRNIRKRIIDVKISIYTLF